MAVHDSNTIIKYADDMTVVGLITDDDETAYREEVRDLAVRCQDNNLSLNVSKTKQLNRGLQGTEGKAKHTPFTFDWAVVERVESFKFLGVHITKNTVHTVVKRARQRLFPLRGLKRFGKGPSDPQKVLQLHH